MSNPRPDHASDVAQPLPWERHSDETDKSYEGFLQYVKLGSTRTLAAVAKIIGHRQDTHVKRWSARYGWVERARAYDDHMEAAEFEAALEERKRLAREAVARQAEVQRGFFEHVTQAPQSLRDLADDQDAGGGARVRAWQLILDSAGYTPIPAADTSTDASEQLVAELHRLATHLEPREADYLFHLLDKALEFASQDPEEGGEEGEEEDDGGA